MMESGFLVVIIIVFNVDCDLHVAENRFQTSTPSKPEGTTVPQI
jgi:hypothetical protein